jgi:hypothetical protein
MKYAVEMGSGALICISSFINSEVDMGGGVFTDKREIA